MRYILAVDGGGTKTDLVLIDEYGRLQERVRRGPSNYQNIGAPKALAILKEGIEALLLPRALNVGDLAAACLGLAGLDTEQDERVYAEIIRSIFGDHSDTVRAENDCFIALHSGTLGDAGIALIAGTGSMAIACNEGGQRARSGGWGYRFGDEGSGYYIGYQAIVRSLKGRDGRGEVTRLAADIEEAMGVDLFTLVTRYNAEDPGPDLIGSLAPLVNKAAQDGDVVAQSILDDAAGELVLAARAIMKQLQFEHHPIRFVFAGGAFNAERMMESVASQLRAAFGDVECIRPKLPPVAGACILALHEAGIPISEEVKSNLSTTSS